MANFYFDKVAGLQKLPPEVLCKRGVLGNFTEKHLCQRRYFSKVARLRLYNGDPNTGVFL